MTGATIQCLSHSANPANTLGAGRVNRTPVKEVQALCTATVLDQQTFWTWHAASNCGRALTMRLLSPLSYTSGAGAAIRTPITDLRGPSSSTELHQHKTSLRQSGGGGENCTPDSLLCRQMPCCLGYTASNLLTNLERKAGLEPALSTLATSRLGH